ncbi:MAG: copper amine oxidase N-terminal domain-containing protein [Clostridia bacterium]|nr:copper amine oxidase N-terminal domain-containing protein [Clostridia bacterium]
MKKLTTLILTATMMMSSIAINVQAAGRITTIDEALADASQIHILYNDTVVEYEDVKPVNTEGRVMIPFRAVLEDMGATVEYDDSQRLVTATKGETQIKFTLMDDTIYINNNGVDSTITMDVPMIIVEGRTLVPIRFMSNALGMQVGWDGETETVVIMDYNDYFGGLNETMPNFAKLADVKQPVFNKEYVGFDMFLSVDDAGEKTELTLGGDVDGTYADGAAQVEAKLDLTVEGQEIKDITLDLAFKDTSVYAKTNLVDKITNEEVKSKLSSVKADTWYKIDLKAVFEAMELPAESIAAFESAMATMGSNESVSLEDVFKNMVTTEGDAKFEDVVSMAMMMDVFEVMDKYIAVEEKANGAYSVSMNMTTVDLIDMVVAITGEELSDAEKKIVDDMIDFDVSAVSECDGKKMDSNVKIVMNLDAGDSKLNFTLEMTDKAETDSKAKVEDIKDCEDITQLLIEALK